jgi:glycosyltransferase involved in cell wall biosynthesis
MGVDCARFHAGRRNERARARLMTLAGAEPGATLVLYAGRLAPEKDLGLLIDAAALLDPALFRIVIAGGGMLLEPLRRDCERRGLAHVAFLGHVADREELANHYANADVFLHPNAREPFGIAPLEAMASGLPLVAPAAGGVVSYAREANSWPVVARRENLARALAEAVRTVRNCPEESVRRARAARATAEEHRWPKVTEHYLRLYRHLHALTIGQRMDEMMTPRAYSTPGDVFGRELAQHIFPKMF